MVCPKCQSEHIDVQVFQENRGSETQSQTNFQFKEKGHSALWWICIGWWYVLLIKLPLWLIAFPFMAAMRLGRKKKYQGSTTGQSSTQNQIGYRRVFLCKDCGHSWYE